MTTRSIIATFAASLAIAPLSAAGQDDAHAEALAALEDALPGTLVNDPLDVSWSTFGQDYRAKVVKAEEIPGGMAYRVKVRSAKPNPWDVSAQAPVTGGVEAGDVVLLAFWARATDGAPATIQARVAQTAAPYAGVAEGSATLSEGWQIHYVSGRAPEAYAPGALGLSLNVATASQTVEFGQYYVMDMGPNADPAQMPSGATDP